jgi:peptide deformylase
MAVLPILTVPDPRLRVKAKPVAVVDDKIRQILDDMLETMYHAKGIGLAATQVGIALRLVVIDLSAKDTPFTPMKLVNPQITWTSQELETCQEGCLSVPEQFADVSRPKGVKMTYQDEHGKDHVLETDEFLATCIQHELDHLDGKLYIDYLSSLKRTILVNKVKRLKLYKDEKE